MSFSPPTVWQAEAQRVFDADASVATVSMVTREFVSSMNGDPEATAWQAAAAVWPYCYVNPAVTELIDADGVTEWTPDQLESIVSRATARGLSHVWRVAGMSRQSVVRLLPAVTGDRVVIGALPLSDSPADPLIRLGVDAQWLLGSESGAQVFVSQLIRAMIQGGAVQSVTFLSDRGAVPEPLADLPNVTGRTWTDALASGLRFDILHRPYQPGVDTDLDRYRQLAPAVAITVLDLIAYDNPTYHESHYAFRSYQRAFDAKVCGADQVLAISRHVGERLQRQFAHRLLAPVRVVPLGVDHLSALQEPGRPPAALGAIAPKGFFVVLGNDFAHKNRDFAVKVFAELCRRGYQGHLVLAGFHLDQGSSFDYEMTAAGAYAHRVIRIAALGHAEKVWVLRNAEAVLYPTSSEGFGLVPFEAAALGTPTAFVRVGPLAETLNGVPAAGSWHVAEFAELVLKLVAEPDAFLDGVAVAARSLTWEHCAEQTVSAYRELLRTGAPWRSAVDQNSPISRSQRFTEFLAERVRRASRRFLRLG
jgi:glycosyltransferase involved in cell wall biosynthesis